VQLGSLSRPFGLASSCIPCNFDDLIGPDSMQLIPESILARLACGTLSSVINNSQHMLDISYSSSELTSAWYMLSGARACICVSYQSFDGI
jgi:hypothetical protein